jgi:Uracil DNA glycosylase superfamily
MANGLDHLLDSAHRGVAPAELARTEPDALYGLSADDAKALDHALHVDSIRALAEHRFVAAARAVCDRADDVAFDRGPDAGWAALFASAPHATYAANPDDFRLDFGPAYYRGRLDGTARVLVVGQDPAANELLAHRVFVGASGQRVQGFLRRIGIHRDYVMVNTFLYPVYGQFVGSLRQLTRDPAILGFRNEVLDRVAEHDELEAIVTVGGAAADAVSRWPGAAGLAVVAITHPSARDTAALLANWNVGLGALRAAVAPETPGTIDDTTYGSKWTDADVTPIPRGDLPFGVPEWMGDGSHGDRARAADGTTDPKAIVWTAP